MPVTLCTEEVIEVICNNLRLGSYLESAVIMADVSKETFYKWIKASRSEDHPDYKPIYATLRHAVEKAQEEATTRDLLNIDKAAMGSEPQFMRDENGGIVFENGKPVVLKPGARADWSASAWRLERRKPKEWGRTEKLELTGKDGGAIATAELSDEQKVERQKKIDGMIKKRQLLNGR